MTLQEIKNCLSSDWEPRFLYPSKKEDADLIHCLREDPQIFSYDEIDSQVGEMLRARFPKKKLKGESLKKEIEAFFENRDRFSFGVWVYYPWSRRLVHLLDEEDFIFTRMSPNNPKITRDEQAILREKKIGVVGLSVGQSISLVSTMERICGEIRIADYDVLELANLNRIRAGVHSMGVNKSVMVAREIKEIDPYFTIRVFTDGLTQENLHPFFHEHGDLDLVVDECDSIDIKILLRVEARKMKIPVVMDMSDRGTIDVERFDLEPDRPILHGWIDHLDYTQMGGMTNEEKIPFMLPIFGMDTISKRLKASMIEVGESIHTWPQLATSVAMGGALAADTVRRIFLDQFHDSGRYFIDLDELIRDKDFQKKPFVPEHWTYSKLEKAQMISAADNAMKDLNWDQGILKEHTATQLVELAGMAPSAGNNQPWKWLFHKGHLFLFHEKSRSYGWTDYDDSLAMIGLGAASENMELAAGRNKLRCSEKPLFKDQLIAAYSFEADQNAPEDELAKGIEIRCSNRKKGHEEPISDAIMQSIQDEVAKIPGMAATFIYKAEEKEAWAKIVGRAERLRFLDPQAHFEFFHDEIRWTPEEVERTRDGLDIETLELTASQTSGMEVASDQEVMTIIRQWDKGDGLAKLSADSVRSSSGLCLLTSIPEIPQKSLLPGKAVQRAWITANTGGWSVHPVSAPLFFINRLQKQNNLLNNDLIKEIQLFKAEIDKTSPILQENRGIFLFRISQGGNPSKRALRLAVEDILIKA
ncbi:MAG: Rv1355c family protein [Bacteroidetes bacterium]|nr:Rv1355c family protein [Bacteroidota bacterium]